MSKTTNKFSPEVRARAVRMVLDHEGDYPSRWSAVVSVADKTLNEGCIIKNTILFLAALTYMAVSTTATAEPSMRVTQGGSYIVIYMSNPEDRAYNCSIRYDWQYDSFGDIVTGQKNFSVGVSKTQNEFVAHDWTGSMVNLKVTSGPFMSCNPT